jgi:hypothetical protein
MFNEYSVYKLMKFRKEETERNAQNAWKYSNDPNEINVPIEITLHSNKPVQPCCQCTCA